MNSYDRIAWLYDLDMGLNNDGKDIAYYLAQAQCLSGDILELGCGTGRITVPLVKSGFRVTALDSSLAMLRIMKSKRKHLHLEENQRLSVICADMRWNCLHSRYKMILCPFSLLTYLITDEDLRAFFQNIRAWLAPEGRFLMDVFIPQASLQSTPDESIPLDYRRSLPNSYLLERRKQILRVRQKPPLNNIRRFYKILSRDYRTLEEFDTVETIRLFYPDNLMDLLQSNGFHIESCQGGFQNEPLEEHSQVTVLACSRSN